MERERGRSREGEKAGAGLESVRRSQALARERLSQGCPRKRAAPATSSLPRFTGTQRQRTASDIFRKSLPSFALHLCHGDRRHSPPASSAAMAPRLNVGALSIVVVLIICTTFADASDNYTCPSGYKTCGVWKCKTNVWSDLNNCGDCGVQCRKSVPYGYSECKKGMCMVDCKRGFGNCDGNATNGCETRLTTVDHCGSCNKVCIATKNHTVAVCDEGRCKVQCASNYTRCEHGCVDLQTDKYNCGRCEHVCHDKPATNTSAATTGVCIQGKCEQVGQCFPGDATVRLEHGEVKLMTELNLGDKVAVMKPDGSIAYEDVYVFGHRDASAISTFVRLTLQPVDAEVSNSAIETRNLELSASHFVPISAAAGNLFYKRAGDVSKGDRMWVQGASSGASTSFFVVTGTSEATKQGLYNPYTLGGTIIVNGVVASAHSDWFLDHLFETLGLVHWLPAAYQVVLLPVRMLYNGLGKDLYVAVYQRFDAQVNVAEVGSKYGGSVVAAVGVASAAVAVFMSSRVMSKKV